MVEKIIIDTDPGIDDAVALFVALANPDIQVLGVTTVNGNVGVDKSFLNARKITEFCWHSDVKVYRGCDKPLKRTLVNAAWVHGEDGLAGLQLPAPTEEPEKTDAVDFIIDTLKNAEGKEVSIVALGPLTNIATAFLKEPKIIRKIREIVIMGGGFSQTGPRGNTTPWAEFNMWADPHAAQVVFDAAEQMTVVPMEVGMQVVTGPDYIARLRDIRTKAAYAAADMIEKTIEFVEKERPDLSKDGIALYDPVAMTCLMRPGLFSGRYGKVTVNTDAEDEKFGMTTFFEDEKIRNCLVTHKVNAESVLDFMADSLAALP